MILSLNNVERRFGELVVISGITANFVSGRSYAIYGKSGSGKSTLLNIMSGLDIPTAGEVRYDNTNLFSLSTDQRARIRNQQVGFIFQFHQLLPEFSALENVAMPLFIRGIPEDEALGRADKLLATVGLSARVKHRPSQLSGGEQQRVSVARALVTEPDIVFADEPTGSLDHATSNAVWGLVREMCKDRLLVVVTHDNELVGTVDERLEMVSGGKLETRN